ncbi:MAG: hypothetical protein Q7R96_05040 [Nanoarchaeota archaeon]|nr:hypothetical protein [Nanoarchaeota archaeon]
MSRPLARRKQELPATIDATVLVPFKQTPQTLKNFYDLDKVIRTIYDQEAERLHLPRERYEYTCINQLYPTEHPALEQHYIMYDPGPALLRGIIGNAIGRAVKKETGIDLGKIFEQTQLSFEEVLPTFPGVDVPGYGHFHTFFNVLNKHLTAYNLLLGYLRNEGMMSFRHGFNDYVGLMYGLPGKGLGTVTAGAVEMEAIQDLDESNDEKAPEDRLYVTPVQGGTLYMAPLAACNWDLNHLEGMRKREFLTADPEDLPLKCRQENTFHWLNGATPHYFREHIVETCYRRIHEETDIITKS